MFEGVDQHEVAIRPDGSIVIPAILREKLRCRPGFRLLLEETDDGVLVTEIEVPGDEL